MLFLAFSSHSSGLAIFLFMYLIAFMISTFVIMQIDIEKIVIKKSEYSGRIVYWFLVVISTFIIANLLLDFVAWF